MVASVGPTGVGSVTVDFWSIPLQAFDPAIVTEAPGVARAGAAFVLTVLFGGAVIYRYGGKLDDAVTASMSRPLVSTIYGFMAFGIVLFLLGYAFNQVAKLGLDATVLWVIISVVVGATIFSLGGMGFVVVGAWAAETLGTTDPWLGLVGVGAVSAVVWLLLPFVVGALVWVIIAAVGIGGPARHWVHGTTTDLGSG